MNYSWKTKTASEACTLNNELESDFFVCVFVVVFCQICTRHSWGIFGRKPGCEKEISERLKNRAVLSVLILTDVSGFPCMCINTFLFPIQTTFLKLPPGNIIKCSLHYWFTLLQSDENRYPLNLIRTNVSKMLISVLNFQLSFRIPNMGAAKGSQRNQRPYGRSGAMGAWNLVPQKTLFAGRGESCLKEGWA